MGHFTGPIIAFLLALAFGGPQASAQSTLEETGKPCEAKCGAQQSAPETIQTIFLANAVETSDVNDIVTDLRSMLPKAKIFDGARQNAITIRATAEDMEAARKLIAGFDQPRKLYRLTYSIADVEGGKRTGARQFAFFAFSDEKTTFKQGIRVPIVTEQQNADTAADLKYVDVGLDIEVTVSGSPDSLKLRTKVEQSSLSEEKPAVNATNPVIRQSLLEEWVALTQGKPLVIGSLDTGSSRRQEVEVLAEPVH